MDPLSVLVGFEFGIILSLIIVRIFYWKSTNLDFPIERLYDEQELDSSREDGGEGHKGTD